MENIPIIKRDMKILDIGCNDGYLLDCFGKHGCKTYGFEPANNLVESISSNHKVYNDFYRVDR